MSRRMDAATRSKTSCSSRVSDAVAAISASTPATSGTGTGDGVMESLIVARGRRVCGFLTRGQPGRTYSPRTGVMGDAMTRRSAAVGLLGAVLLMSAGAAGIPARGASEGAVGTAVPGATATFTPLGDLPGGPFESTAFGISADGTTAVGQATSA